MPSESARRACIERIGRAILDRFGFSHFFVARTRSRTHVLTRCHKQHITSSEAALTGTLAPVRVRGLCPRILRAGPAPRARRALLLGLEEPQQRPQGLPGGGALPDLPENALDRLRVCSPHEPGNDLPHENDGDGAQELHHERHLLQPREVLQQQGVEVGLLLGQVELWLSEGGGDTKPKALLVATAILVTNTYFVQLSW